MRTLDRWWLKLSLLLVALTFAGAFATSNIGAAAGPAAPDVSFTTLQGERLRLRDLRGKVVLVNFWATSCPICAKEMPEFAEMYRKYRARGFEILAVAMAYDRPSDVQAYAAKNAPPFRITLDTDGVLARAFDNVKVVPTTFVVDKEGRFVSKTVGVIAMDKLHALLDASL